MKAYENGRAAIGRFFIVLLSVFAVYAQNSANQHMDNGTQKMVSSGDASFAMNAAQGGMAEVRLGQLAVEKASNPGVKAFGQKMVDDHSKANDSLKSAIASGTVTLPTGMSPQDQAEYNKLSQLSGPAFDKAYVKDMIKDHEEDIKAFQKEANRGKDPQLKSFASATLPTLQSHLDSIKSIQAQMGQ